METLEDARWGERGGSGVRCREGEGNRRDRDGEAEGHPGHS